MFDKIKQNAKTLIEISYVYEELVNKKNNNKRKMVEKQIYELIKDTNKEILEIRSKLDKHDR